MFLCSCFVHLRNITIAVSGNSVSASYRNIFLLEETGDDREMISRAA